MKSIIPAIIFLFFLAAPGSAADKQKGVNYHPTWRGAMEMINESAYDQVAHENMLSMGINWLALNVTAYQGDLADTRIRLDTERVGADGVPFFLTPSDEEISFAIRRAHRSGVKVMLKPYVTTLTSFSDSGTWHGMIGSAFTTDEQWREWFASYSSFILHYASLAQETGVDQLCIGTELAATVEREKEWRGIIAAVRKVYRGPITYAAHHLSMERIRWWDQLDYIGLDAYFPLSNKNDPTLAELKEGWQPHLERIAALAAKWSKPVLFTELGYASVDGASRAPWAMDSGRPVDEREQADLYQAFFEEVYPQPWLAGVYWWVWYPRLDMNLPDKNFQPTNKPAEKILKKWYGASGSR